MPEITAELRKVAVRTVRMVVAERFGLLQGGITEVPDETVIGGDWMLLRSISSLIAIHTRCDVLLNGITLSLTVGDVCRCIEQSTGDTFHIRGAVGGRRRKSKTK
jgi:hypothetical protein